MTSFDFYCWSNKWIMQHLPPINTTYLSDNYLDTSNQHDSSNQHYSSYSYYHQYQNLDSQLDYNSNSNYELDLDHHNIPTNTYDSYDESDSSDSDFDTI